MDIVQEFYNSMAADYDKLFLNWGESVREQGEILQRIFADCGFGKDASVLDCACGIGTQAIGLAARGFHVTASDISEAELTEAGKRAKENSVSVSFQKADFRALSDAFSESFDIVMAMDNALPHMLTEADLTAAANSLVGRTKEGGIIVASIRDYDSLLQTKPPYSPPYIHQTAGGKRISFQTWDWYGENYRLVQYIITDEETLSVRKYPCEYRAVRREALTALFKAAGCREVIWKFPEETGFYQPIVVARK